MCWQRWEQKFPLWSDDRSEISLTSSCSASGFFFVFFLLLLAQGHWRWVQRTLITFILLYWLIISISPGTISTDLALDLPPGTVVLFCFFFFLKYEVCVWCMHKTVIRSDLNTHFLEKMDDSFALNYFSEAANNCLTVGLWGIYQQTKSGLSEHQATV